MRRREVITLLGGAAAWPVAARAQQRDRMRLIGLLMGYTEDDPAVQSYVEAFRVALAAKGWTEGGNLRIELRWGAGDADRIRKLAKELVALRPDAVLGVTTGAVSALAHETSTIPIVFANVIDPIGNGFAASVAHPGGNITGFTVLNSAIGSKWVGLLKEIAPRTERMALLFNPATAPPIQAIAASIQTAASSFGARAIAAPVHAKEEIEGVIAEQARTPGGGLIVMPDPFNRRNRDLIIALTARHGVPAIYYTRSLVEAGGLIAYSDDYGEGLRGAAGYVDRILKGEKPADLPLQAATKFELAINMKTAKALGLTVSDKMQLLADEVIE